MFYLNIIFLFQIILFVNGTLSAKSDLPEKKLKSYKQPNDIISGEYDFFTTAQAEKKHICTRPCDGAKPLVCYYSFVLENYATMGPACRACGRVDNSSDCDNPQCVPVDGVERPILTINRQYPAPSIQVCSGDLIVVDLKNHMLDRTIAIHWHGLYQLHTPHMDGVSMVTQCPILPSTTFRYKFPATPFGTFFYHSHQGLQKMDGIVGSLIIRRPRTEDPLSKLYDFDLPSHVFLVTDWLHTMTDARYPGFRFNNIGFLPNSFLVNGKTQFFNSSGAGTKTPYSKFKVTKGKKYRFRLIGATCSNCPVLLAFEKHRMLFIASDGTPAKPTYIDSVTLLPGERFDVVIDANQNIASYWIQIKGLLLCANIVNYAVLEYANATSQYTSTNRVPAINAYQRGKSLNSVDISSCNSSQELCFGNMEALIPPPENDILKAKPDLRLVLASDFYSYTLNQLFQTNSYSRWIQPAANTAASALINNISYIQAPFSLLTQNEKLPPELVCPGENKCGRSLPYNICECNHIIKVPLDSVAELVFVDWTPGNTFLTHPLHLHGTDLFVIKQGKIPPNVDKKVWIKQLEKDLDKMGSSLRKTKPRPIVKDTVANLPSGYSVVRVHFNNPGMWYYHCHFIFHTDTGMTLIFQVGERGNFVKPPRNFPTCNNFMPPVNIKQDFAWTRNKKIIKSKYY